MNVPEMREHASEIRATNPKRAAMFDRFADRMENEHAEPSELAIISMIEADTLARGYALTGAPDLARQRAIRVLAEPSARDKFAGNDLPLFEKLAAAQARFHAATTVAERRAASDEGREIREEFSRSMDRRFAAWRHWNDVA